ncbi:hypothetical protein DFJ74DRAFT_775391 [Hyaloraphidium curvatum]|nr:hypothetical protein DFJ74DRAFT_775391 [Hyaloraphidium curvatum]
MDASSGPPFPPSVAEAVSALEGAARALMKSSTDPPRSPGALEAAAKLRDLLSLRTLENGGIVPPHDPSLPPSYEHDALALRARRAILGTCSPWDGRSALHWAAYNDQLDSLEMLAREFPGAPDWRLPTKGSGTSDGSTQLHKACDTGKLDTAAFLLSLDATLGRTKDLDGRTPLALVCGGDTWLKRRSYKVSTPEMDRMATLLLDADTALPPAAPDGSGVLEMRTAEGRTPLMLCVRYERAPLALLLVKRGADVRACKKAGGKSAGDKILEMPAHYWSEKWGKDPPMEALVEELKALVRERMAQPVRGQASRVEIVDGGMGAGTGGPTDHAVVMPGNGEGSAAGSYVLVPPSVKTG